MASRLGQGRRKPRRYKRSFLLATKRQKSDFNKFLRLNRVPRVVARVLRKLERAGVNDSFTVMGTQAQYAYEADGGAHFLLELLASGDVDLLYDGRNKTTVVSENIDGNGLLGLLKKAEKTFECVRENGTELPMRVPDLRAFALHKVWLSGLSTRETIKKPRDFEQARIVARLVRENMSQHSFESTLTSLHGDVRKMLPLILELPLSLASTTSSI